MSVPKNWEILKQAIEKYMFDNKYTTEYEASFSGGLDFGVLAVSDPPADFNPSLGLLQDGPEYRLKPIFVAYLMPDGTIDVRETEFTQRYTNMNTKAIV